LVLVGRSQAMGAARETIQEMEEQGAQVVVIKANIAQRRQVENLLATIEQSMPPLRGIMHAAKVLDDGVMLQLDRERFKTVMAPKVNGAWNLHELTLNKQLDFFILYSSAASLLGSPGQGNYVAANAFLDAFAHYRRAKGQPATSINWGVFSE